MASSGKKGKKGKGTVISLQSFLANGDAPAGTTQVSKIIRNHSGDESDDGSNSLPLVYQLPTAPRANRVFDDDSIPHRAPFIAYVTNLPFDANEDDIYAFFGTIPIVSVRLPREDGETGRVRGFGYVEFEIRDDLIHVLSLPDPCIRGRHIRIDLSNENDQQNSRQRSRRGFDNFGNSGENRESTNWRRDNQNSEAGSGGGGGFERGGGYNRDRGDRDRDRERRPREDRDDSNAAGSWRMGGRPVENDYSPRRDRGSDRDRPREMRSYNRPPREERGEDYQAPQSQQSLEERPKLNLKPRTLPLPEIVTKPEEENENVKEIESEKDSEKPVPKPSGVSSEKVFGSAKPVDTAARELAIEERLAEQRRADKLKREEEKAQLSEQLEEMHIEKTDKENANEAISWRRREDVDADGNGSLDREGAHRRDDRRQNNRGTRDGGRDIDEDSHDGRDYNRYNKSRDNNDRNDRPDIQRPKIQQKDQHAVAGVKEDKEKTDDKLKRDIKIERPLPKYQPNQSEPVLQTANKYSGLDDDASD